MKSLLSASMTVKLKLSWVGASLWRSSSSHALLQHSLALSLSLSADIYYTPNIDHRLSGHRRHCFLPFDVREGASTGTSSSSELVGCHFWRLCHRSFYIDSAIDRVDILHVECPQ
jgi:hypothetical protein